MAYLEYLGSVQEGKKELFKFKRGMDLYTLPLSDAISLISKHASKNRNCKVSRGRISYKPNEGNNIPEKVINVSSVNIVTTLSSVGNREFVESVDLYFKRLLNYKDFIYRNRSVISKIDRAKVLDAELGTIETPYGVTDYKHLSSGTKAVLIALFLIENCEDSNFVLNMNECGGNVYDILFDVVEKSDLLLFLNHGTCFTFTKRLYVIDGVKCYDFNDLISKQLYGI